MSNEQEKAIMRQLETEFAGMREFMAVLSQDYKFSRHVLQKDSKNPMYRRMAVRNFCALVEGVIHSFKLITLRHSPHVGVKLSNADMAGLCEEAYELTESGESNSKPQYFRFDRNFKFACKIFARTFECSYSMNYRGEGWTCVKQVFEVRNRLMHPKLLKGLEVSDAEVNFLVKADAWMREVTDGLVGSWNVAKIMEKAKRRRSSELN